MPDVVSCTMVFNEDLGEGSFIPSKLRQTLSGFTVEMALWWKELFLVGD